MASRQKNIRLPEKGWELLADLSVGYGSEAETIVAALEALKWQKDLSRTPHANPGNFTLRPEDVRHAIHVSQNPHELTVEPVYE